MNDLKENKKGKNTVQRIETTVDWIASKIENMKSIDYIYLSEHPYKRLWNNFLNGVARGVGSAIGLSVVFALLILVLKWIAGINIPIISALVNLVLELAGEIE